MVIVIAYHLEALI